MIDVQKIVEMQCETVTHWHTQPIDNPCQGFLADVCKQHSFNYQLWHEEDIARSPDADDSVIARVKRAIDGFNQQRNDWIELVDDHIARMLEENNVQVDETVRINTETPGSVIDRLSILALRIYHLDEQLEREDVKQEHFEKVRHRIAVCKLQQDELSRELQFLLDDMFAGRIRHRTYRQLKMYNDATLNPYLYEKQTSGA